MGNHNSDPHILSLFPELERDLFALFNTGTLPSQGIRQLIGGDHIRAQVPISSAQIQPASIDLRLGTHAYIVPASFLPGRNSTVIRALERHATRKIDLAQPQVLHPQTIYVIPLLESCYLPANVSAKANPKSTTGRLDVFARVLVDYGTEFDRLPAGYKGPLYLEVIPRAFHITVHMGSRLCQLRFVRGVPQPSDASLVALHKKDPLVYESASRPGPAVIDKGLWVSADLVGQNEGAVIGYRATPNQIPIDLDSVALYEPSDFWEPLVSNKDQYLLLAPDVCHILLSRERLAVPAAWAAEMVPFDPCVGEFRVHYAGFFDPGFGYCDVEPKGIPAVLEVRSQVPFLLNHGQTIGRFIFERMLSVPDILYGVAIGSSYQVAGLCLSKQFKRPRVGGSSGPHS